MKFTNTDRVREKVYRQVLWKVCDQVFWKVNWQVRNQVNNKMWWHVYNKINPIRYTIEKEIDK